MEINILSIAKIIRSRGLFEKIDFPYALIKGDALSLQIYGVPGMRNYGDIDILIDRKNLKRVKEILKSEKFIDTNTDRLSQLLTLSFSHQVAPWTKDIAPYGMLEIDLNIDIYWGEYDGEKISISEFLNDTIESSLYNIPVRTLPLDKALLQLILHQYKDMNSIFLLYNNGLIRRSKLNEIFSFIYNNSKNISVEVLFDICSKYKAIPYAFYVLYYTYVATQNDFLLPYVESLRNNEGEVLLNCYGLNKKERREWKCDIYTRINSNNLRQLIEKDLTKEDKTKILINTKIMGFGK